MIIFCGPDGALTYTFCTYRITRVGGGGGKRYACGFRYAIIYVRSNSVGRLYCSAYTRPLRLPLGGKMLCTAEPQSTTALVRPQYSGDNSNDNKNNNNYY
jgi:hypothetical protein